MWRGIYRRQGQIVGFPQFRCHPWSYWKASIIHNWTVEPTVDEQEYWAWFHSKVQKKTPHSVCEQGWRKGTTTRKFVLQGGSKSVYIIQEEIKFNQPTLNLGSFIQVIPHAIHHQESEEGRGHQKSHLGSTSRYTNHPVHSCWYDKSSFWPPWYLTPTTRGF